MATRPRTETSPIDSVWACSRTSNGTRVWNTFEHRSAEVRALAVVTTSLIIVSVLGIELIEHCNGDVSIRNRSWSCSVFVQSILYNRLNGLNDSTVYHLQSRQSIHSIFNSSIFTQLVNDPLSTYETILDLTKLCTIQVSFKYGWGYDFGQREITSAPCWLSVLINEPLRLIDHRLQQLQPEQATTSS